MNHSSGRVYLVCRRAGRADQGTNIAAYPSKRAAMVPIDDAGATSYDTHCVQGYHKERHITTLLVLVRTVIIAGPLMLGAVTSTTAPASG
ncbi:MAG TPA: hypothetical protein VGW38_02810 [Chloroflexota bacterium]|nr:hypothetical protein [Chloroflexota bacterium]